LSRPSCFGGSTRRAKPLEQAQSLDRRRWLQCLLGDVRPDVIEGDAEAESYESDTDQ